MGLLDAIGYVGDSFDKLGGRATRGLFGGHPRELLSPIPFSDRFGITDPRDIVTGRNVTDLMHLTDRSSDSLLSSAIGLGAEVALDPWNAAGGIGLVKSLAKPGGVAAAGKKIAAAGGAVKSAGARAGRALGFGKAAPEVAAAARAAPEASSPLSALWKAPAETATFRPRREELPPNVRHFDYRGERGLVYPAYHNLSPRSAMKVMPSFPGKQIPDDIMDAVIGTGPGFKGDTGKLYDAFPDWAGILGLTHDPETARFAARELMPGSVGIGSGAEAGAARTTHNFVTRIGQLDALRSLNPYSQGRPNIREMLQSVRTVVSPDGRYIIDHSPLVNPISRGSLGNSLSEMLGRRVTRNPTGFDALQKRNARSITDSIHETASELSEALARRINREHGLVGWDLHHSIPGEGTHRNPTNISYTGEGNILAHDPNVVWTGAPGQQPYNKGIIGLPPQPDPANVAKYQKEVAELGGPEAVQLAMQRGLSEGTVGQGIPIDELYEELRRIPGRTVKGRSLDEIKNLHGDLEDIASHYGFAGRANPASAGVSDILQAFQTPADAAIRRPRGKAAQAAQDAASIEQGTSPLIEGITSPGEGVAPVSRSRKATASGVVPRQYTPDELAGFRESRAYPVARAETAATRAENEFMGLAAGKPLTPEEMAAAGQKFGAMPSVVPPSNLSLEDWIGMVNDAPPGQVKSPLAEGITAPAGVPGEVTMKELAEFRKTKNAPITRSETAANRAENKFRKLAAARPLTDEEMAAASRKFGAMPSVSPLAEGITAPAGVPKGPAAARDKRAAKLLAKRAAEEGITPEELAARTARVQQAEADLLAKRFPPPTPEQLAARDAEIAAQKLDPAIKPWMSDPAPEMVIPDNPWVGEPPPFPGPAQPTPPGVPDSVGKLIEYVKSTYGINPEVVARKGGWTVTTVKPGGTGKDVHVFDAKGGLRSAFSSLDRPPAAAPTTSPLLAQPPTPPTTPPPTAVPTGPNPVDVLDANGNPVETAGPLLSGLTQSATPGTRMHVRNNIEVYPNAPIDDPNVGRMAVFGRNDPYSGASIPPGRGGRAKAVVYDDKLDRETRSRIFRQEYGHALVNTAVAAGPAAIRKLPPVYQPGAWAKYLGKRGVPMGAPTPETYKLGQWLDEMAQNSLEVRGMRNQLRELGGFVTDPDVVKEYAGMYQPGMLLGGLMQAPVFANQNRGSLALGALGAGNLARAQSQINGRF